MQCETYSDDLGEYDAECWLHCSVDHGTDGPDQHVGPLGTVEAHQLKE